MLLSLCLAGCRVPAVSTDVMHRFSDRALEIANRADPEAGWVREPGSDRQRGMPYSLPHTEVVVLEGRVQDDERLFEQLEIEVLGTIARDRMRVGSSRRVEEGRVRTRWWRYHWARGEGVITIAGARRDDRRYLLAITVNETERPD
jgi:hypothetical protein